MKLSLPPYTRAAVAGLALSVSVFTTLVAVAPAGAAPDGSALMAYKGVVVQPVLDAGAPVTPDATTPTDTPAQSEAPTQDPSQPVDATPTPETTPSAVLTPTPVAAPSAPSVPQPVASTPTQTPTQAQAPTPTPAPRPTRAPHPVTPPAHRPTPTHQPRPTHPSGSSLSQAIAGIPGYAAGQPVQWVISSQFGHYGMTDWYHNTIYLSPGIPSSQLASVAKHEYGHILEARAYNGNIQAMIAGISRIFGGGGRGNLNGTELAADCIAIVNGASWTNYTSCGNPAWRAAARELIAGREL